MIGINKRNKLIVTLIVLIIAVILLCLGVFFLNNPSIDIPKLNNLSRIELYENNTNKYHVIEGTENIKNIYNALLKSKKNNHMESVNDSPIHGYDIKIVLTDNDKNTTTLFVYKGDYDDYYVELPYSGIYRISQSEYTVLTQFF